MKDVPNKNDSASETVRSSLLTSPWMEILLSDCEEEANSDHVWPQKLLELEARALIWSMCSSLSVEINGIPGQACMLMERFLAAQMRLLIKLSIGYNQWNLFRRSLLAQLPLLIMSCIQLAAKMSSAGIVLNAKVVRASLLCKGLHYSVKEINQSEYRVFSTLGFRVPLWTSVEAAEMIAMEVGLPRSMLEGVALMVNLAEFCRVEVDHRVRWAANVAPPEPTDRSPVLRTLHLIAGSVAASARFLKYAGPDLSPRLAALTRTSAAYIRCVSNVILAECIIEHEIIFKQNDRKRKRE